MIENLLKKMKIFRNFHISYMNNTNKIDMKKNNYLSKNINFLTPRPPKYNINLLKNENFDIFDNFVFSIKNHMYNGN